jgi:hypothetical protein
MRISNLINKQPQQYTVTARWEADDVQKMHVDLLRSAKQLEQFMGTLNSVSKKLDAGKADFGPLESKINDILGIRIRFQSAYKELLKFQKTTIPAIVKFLKKTAG